MGAVGRYRGGQCRARLLSRLLPGGHCTDEGPFLSQERDLDAIAERNGKIIERRSMEESLRLSALRLEALSMKWSTCNSSRSGPLSSMPSRRSAGSRSEIGYFHFVKEDQKAWSSTPGRNGTRKPAPSPRTVTIPRPGLAWPTARGSGDRDPQRLLRPCLRRRATRKRYSPIRRHPSVPIINGKVIAIRRGQQVRALQRIDVLHLELFMQCVWQILERRRAIEEKDALLAILEEKN